MSRAVLPASKAATLALEATTLWDKTRSPEVHSQGMHNHTPVCRMFARSHFLFCCLLIYNAKNNIQTRIYTLTTTVTGIMWRAMLASGPSTYAFMLFLGMVGCALSPVSAFSLVRQWFVYASRPCLHTCRCAHMHMLYASAALLRQTLTMPYLQACPALRSAGSIHAGLVCVFLSVWETVWKRLCVRETVCGRGVERDSLS